MGGQRLLIAATVVAAVAVADGTVRRRRDHRHDDPIGVEAAVGSLSLDGENLGFMLAFEEANAAGGVHGRRFVWTERRRASGEPADVLAVARRMIDDDHVFALVNFSGPAIGDIVSHARSARVPVLFPHTALVSSEGERYLFTSFPRFEGEAEVMFRYLAKERGLRHAGHRPRPEQPTARDSATASRSTPPASAIATPAPSPSRRAGRPTWRRNSTVWPGSRPMRS